jgi:hypothetical protein
MPRGESIMAIAQPAEDLRVEREREARNSTVRECKVASPRVPASKYIQRHACNVVIGAEGDRATRSSDTAGMMKTGAIEGRPTVGQSEESRTPNVKFAGKQRV